MSDMKGLHLAFDLDGTLVDTAPDIIATLNKVLALADIAPVAVDQARSLVGQGVLSLLRKAYATVGRTLEKDDESLRFTQFIELYRAHIADYSTPFDNMVKTLEGFKAQGAALTICTNKPHDLAVLLIEKLQLSYLFDAIFGADAVTKNKPDPAHLIACCEAVGIGLEQTILIGDSQTDFETAQNAGVPSILVTFGYSDPHVSELKAHAHIDHFDELGTCLSQIIMTSQS